MVLVRKWVILGCYAGACLLVGGLGTYAYRVLARYNALADPASKFQAENIIFYALICLILLTNAVVLLIKKSTDVLTELDKAGDIMRFGQVDLENYLNRWGDLGIRIGTLTRRLERLSAMRSQYIASQSGIIAFFLQNGRAPLFIMDATGKIGQVSRRFLERCKRESGTLPGSHVAELMPGIDFGDLKTGLDREHTVIHRKDCRVAGGEKELEFDFAFYPVFNTAGLISHIICVIEDENLVVEWADKGLQFQQQLQAQVKRQGGQLPQRLFGAVRGGWQSLAGKKKSGEQTGNRQG